MINLLPEQERKDVRGEYIFRLISLVAFFVFLSTLLGVAALLPSYFFSQSKEIAALERISAIEKSIESREQDSSRALLSEMKTKISVLSADKDQEAISKIFEKIIETKTDQIKITGMFYELAPGNIGRVTISGISQNRESLIDFTKSLRSDTSFSDVKLPVSNLAQGEDINFSVKVFGAF